MATGDGIITLAVQKLADFLIQEAKFLGGVNDEMVSIRDELTWMRSFLKDAEQKQARDERIRLWVAEIRSIAFQTEDIIDTYRTEVKGIKPSKRKLLTVSLRKFFCIAGENNVYDIGKEVRALKERLGDITRKREVYGINNIGSSVQEIASAAEPQDQMLRDLRRTTSFADEEHFVGFDDDLKLLEKQLFTSELRRSVISILGMGGLGKTSLARKLYNTHKSMFELHAWVCVSQDWNTKDLLARIIKSLRKPTHEELNMLEKMNDDDMKRHLHELLKDKRYLVVIDDIWDEKAWECLRSVVPNNQTRSRVIITTRNESVAELSDERTYVHKLRRLQEDESWELFCKKAFPKQDSACPQDLQETGKEMVAKCDGLPLAIIVLGGLLSRKQHSHEWHAIKKHIWRALIDKSIHISALLDLSYNDLPRKLQSCFLYLGIFPEDYEIRSEKLIQLWIAEDLVPPYEGFDLEELGESYIKELNARSMIQSRNNESRLGSICRVHDLLRDLAVKKARELDFYHIYGESLNPTIQKFSTRRIAFRSGFERFTTASDDHSHTQVHTLSFLNYYSSFDDGDVKNLLALLNTKFKSLRVLDLDGVKILNRELAFKLVQEIGKLVHLRYLGLSDENICVLPESIGNLHALQVVDMFKATLSTILPRDVCKLKHVRHLTGFFVTKSGDTFMPLNSPEELTNLHSLQHINIDGWLRNEEGDEFALKAFSRLRDIRILSVSFKTGYRLSIEPLLSCKNLIELTLIGSIKSLPIGLHESLPNLRYIDLFHSSFEQDPLPALGKLPHLLALDLDGFKVESVVITAAGFYKLVHLSLRNIPTDMSLLIEEGALPSLKHIRIDPSEKFTLPERFNDMKIV